MQHATTPATVGVGAASNTAALLSQAQHMQLPRSQQERLVAELQSNFSVLHACSISNVQFTSLLQFNPAVAAVVRRMMG